MTRNSEKVSFSRRGRLGAASRLAAKRNFFIKFIEERLRLCFYAPLRTCSAVKVSETWCPKPGSVLCPQVLNHELAACPHRFVSHFRLHFHFNPLTCHIERNVSVSLFHENHYITSMEINLLDQCYNSSCERFTNFSIQSSQIFFCFPRELRNLERSRRSNRKKWRILIRLSSIRDCKCLLWKFSNI